jgi:hypothetical protein
VPEPSPFFWPAFRAQVERRIGSEPRPRLAFWPALLASAAVLVAASSLVPGLRDSRPASEMASARAWSALPPEAEDASLPVLEGALSSLGDEAALADCRGVARCLVGLTDEEQRALLDAMRRELSGRQS